MENPQKNHVPVPRSLSRLVALLAGLFLVDSAPAANLYWDPISLNGSALGGTGTWDTFTANWWPGSGVADQAWVNANNDTAFFSGVAGTATLGSGITAGGLAFATTGYAVATGANTLTLSPTASIRLANVNAATITGALAGGATGVTINRATTGANSTTGILSLNGTSTGGWAGVTTLTNGAVLSLAGSNQALLNTSAIALGGGITLTNTNATEAGLDRVNNSAALTSNGGSFTVNNTVAAATPYAETIGSVSLTSGKLTVFSANANTGGTQVLTLSGLTRSGAANTSTVAFSGGGGLNTTTNRINVTGATATPAGQIIGPWATTGASATSQTDYAGYDASGNVLSAGIAASAETTWTTAANAYTLSGGSTLTGARTITALRATGGAQTLALAGNTLETNGILNGGSGLFTISGAGVIRQQGAAAGSLFVNAGNAAITISSTIANNTGALSLVKSGTGTLTLSAANSFTGTTIVQEGTLIANANNALGGNTVVVGSLGGGQAATLTSAGSFVSSAKAMTVYSNGTYDAGGSPQHLTSLNIVGGTVTGSQIYFDSSATVTMTGGTFAAAAYNSLANITTLASDVTATHSGYFSSGSLVYNVADGSAAVDLRVSGVNASQYGTLTKTGAGVMELSGANTFGGVGGGGVGNSTSVTGGTLLLSNSLALQNSVLATGGTGIVFNSSVASHAFQFGGLSGSANLALLDNASTPNAVALTLNVRGSTARTYTGTLSGAGASLIKSGTGTQILTGAQTYTGATTVNAGTLLVNGSLAAGSAVTVGASGTLGGTGTINGATTIEGTHNPGNSPGIQTFGDDLTYTGGASVVNWELKSNTTINAANPNAVFDTIIVSGDLDFAGATTLNLSFVPTGSTVLWSDSFWATDHTGTGGWLLYDVAGTTTGFANLDLNTTDWLDSSSAAFDTARPDGSFSLYQDGNDIYLNYTAVPEPSTAVLLAGSLALVALRRRQRRA